MQPALVVGLAKTGLAVAKQLISEGRAVVVIDDGPLTASMRLRVDEVLRIGARVEIGPDSQRLFALVRECEFVVPSPGVRPSHPVLVAAREGQTPVRSEIDLAAERFSFPIVAITGTNGKTTTVEMTTAMLQAGGLKVASGGNIGTPLISFVGDDLDVIVAEVSSFQLEFVTQHWRPRVAVILNIADDHLDWHGTLNAYKAAKSRIARFQTQDDALVLNIDDDVVRSISVDGSTDQRSRLRPKVLTVTIAENGDGEFRVEREALVAYGEEMVKIAELPRSLPHDLTNSLCACAATFATRSLLGASADLASVVSVLRNYETLPHRVQFIGENLGVKYFNDSKATNPHATLRAVSAFDSVVLIAGGLNKGLDLSILRSVVSRIRSVVAIGAAAGEVAAAFEGFVEVQRATGMADAVRRSATAAQSGDVVLLSPGCASFDMYPDGYTARGDDFVREVLLMSEESVA